MKRLLNTLYVTNPDAYLRKKDDSIAVYVEDKQVANVPFHLIESILLFGHVGCSTGLMCACAERGVTVVLLDDRGRFKARVEGEVSGNVLLRKRQYELASDQEESLRIAKRFVRAKVHNERVVLQRYARDYSDLNTEEVSSIISELEIIGKHIPDCSSPDALRGDEGTSARLYFSVLGKALRNNDVCFTCRSRRPPRDQVNAALSFFYTILAREISTACESVGLDPQMGYLHTCRPGRASLSLDLIEELRAPIVDRFVWSLFNRRQIGSNDFRQQGQGWAFEKASMKRCLDAWQTKKQTNITHPFLKEKMPLGLLPFVQAQLFARYLRGDLSDYPAFLWR